MGPMGVHPAVAELLAADPPHRQRGLAGADEDRGGLPAGPPVTRSSRWTETAWVARWTKKLASASSEKSQGGPDSRRTSV
eukprot:15420437-Alexandrium_andersonii.AAC.1